MNKGTRLLGIDFGTDSVRALVCTPAGEVIRTAQCRYPRWQSGQFCDPSANQYRQHPLDHLESMTTAVREAVAEEGHLIAGLAMTTTGSTPAPVDQTGTPLALLDQFADHPGAMFYLWKDHTAVQEAEDITAAAKRSTIDYTRYSGNSYSSEWFWAKLLFAVRHYPELEPHLYGWVEHSDYLVSTLTGVQDYHQIIRNRCAAGHKAMWHENWQGYPPVSFWEHLHPAVARVAERTQVDTKQAGDRAGTLTPSWAERLQLPEGIPVAVSALDAHVGAIGGGIKPGQLSKVLGTSTCDLVVVAPDSLRQKVVEGIAGQVDGSILPGLIGLEAGQAAFGDLFAWLARFIGWYTGDSDDILDRLSQEAAPLAGRDSLPLATDWFNGRRSPDPDQRLKGTLWNVDLSTTPPQVFFALVEAACFGSRAILERIEQSKVTIDEIVALGGIAKKSPFVLQTLANVLNRPVKVVAGTETVARGAAMIASIAAGAHADLPAALRSMGSGFSATYEPNKNLSDWHHSRYQQYLEEGRN